MGKKQQVSTDTPMPLGDTIFEKLGGNDSASFTTGTDLVDSLTTDGIGPSLHRVLAAANDHESLSVLLHPDDDAERLVVHRGLLNRSDTPNLLLRAQLQTLQVNGAERERAHENAKQQRNRIRKRIAEKEVTLEGIKSDARAVKSDIDALARELRSLEGDLLEGQTIAPWAIGLEPEDDRPSQAGSPDHPLVDVGGEPAPVLSGLAATLLEKLHATDHGYMTPDEAAQVVNVDAGVIDDILAGDFGISSEEQDDGTVLIFAV